MPKEHVEVTLYNYKAKAWTGLEYGQECFFPTWVVAEDSPEVLVGALLVAAATKREGHKQTHEKCKPSSTNGHR